MEAIRLLAFRRFGTKFPHLAGAGIDAVDIALLAFGVKGVAIRRIKRDVKSVAASEIRPIPIHNAVLALHAGRADPVRVVLQATRDAVVGLRIVERDAVELAGGNPVQVLPRFPGGVAGVNAAVRAEQDPLGEDRLRRFVFVLGLRRLRRDGRARLNGERVAIGMHFLGVILAKTAAAIVRNEKRETEHVNALVVRRIDSDFAEVKRARVDVARARPGFARVLGAEHSPSPAVNVANVARAAFIALHDRHHDLRIARRDGETDAAGLPGKSAGQLLPGGAAVRALENAAGVLARGRNSVGETPRRPLPRVEGGVENLRVRRIHHHIRAARARGGGPVGVQDVRPGLACIGGFEEAALAAIGPEVTTRRHVGRLRIFRMHDDAPDRAALFQPHVLPIGPAVGRTVDAIAPTGGIAIRRFARADPKDVGIRGRDADRANG